MIGRPRGQAWMVCLGILGLVLGCRRRDELGDGNRSSAFLSTGGAAPSSRREPHVPRRGAPTQLMADATSAYTAGLVLDDDAIYLLTQRVAYRLAPGTDPQQIPIENGGMAALTRTDLVYWARGAIWGIPKLGGKARRLASLPHQPQFFMAAGDDIA